VYQIGKYEITADEYAAFLNAVAQDDPHELYRPSMGVTTDGGGIRRSGEPGNYQYETIPELSRYPVNGIDIWRAARFANWLHNGQPVGSQGPATTEDGAYTLSAEAIEANSWTRNAGARYFLPNVDEWYKAAFYKGGGVDAGYWEYPTASDTVPRSSYPSDDANTAALNLLGTVPVGSYPNSSSAYGTFDQAGNVYEWTDVIGGNGFTRHILGGYWGLSSPAHEAFLSASEAFKIAGSATPSLSASYGSAPGFGFRIASVPEPTGAAFFLCVLSCVAFRRKSRYAQGDMRMR
jgi:formylglycine-generating enzyme required for sulfatase activity